MDSNSFSFQPETPHPGQAAPTFQIRPHPLHGISSSREKPMVTGRGFRERVIPDSFEHDPIGNAMFSTEYYSEASSISIGIYPVILHLNSLDVLLYTFSDIICPNYNA
jgi:hypothetical protein